MLTFLSLQLAQFTGDLGTFTPPTDAYQPGTTAQSTAATLERIISTSIGVMTVIAGLAFLLFFLFGALQWVSAGGESGKIDSAKKQMTNGAIGLIIVVMAYGIIAVVGQVVGLDILNPGRLFLNLGPNGANVPGGTSLNLPSGALCATGANCASGSCINNICR